MRRELAVARSRLHTIVRSASTVCGAEGSGTSGATFQITQSGDSNCSVDIHYLNGANFVRTQTPLRWTIPQSRLVRIMRALGLAMGHPGNFCEFALRATLTWT